MRKLLAAVSLVTIFILAGCTQAITPGLNGSYQSEREGVGYVFVLTFQEDDHSFVEYIDNREVDCGTYEKSGDHVYAIKSEKQNFDVSLNEQNSFEIRLRKVNNGEPIIKKHLDDTPIYFSTEFDDVEQYEAMLD